MSAADQPSIPRLTADEQARALAAVERARALQAELRAKYGTAVPESWELLDDTRRERAQDWPDD